MSKGIMSKIKRNNIKCLGSLLEFMGNLPVEDREKLKLHMYEMVG